MRMLLRAAVCVGLAPLSMIAGCATVDRERDLESVSRNVEHAIGRPVPRPAAGDAAVAARIAELLAGGLTADRAVEIALLNNPRIHLRLLDVGLGRAAVVQAGLFSNPSLSAMLRLPDGGGLTNLEFGLAQNIAELWQIPARSSAAAEELERTILDVARAVSETALEAETAYFSAVRADRQRDLARDGLSVTQQLVELAAARRTAGSVSEIDVQMARARHLESQLDVRRAELAGVEARAALATLLGLDTPPGALVLAEPLPEGDVEPPTAAAVIDAARAERLDFRAQRAAVAAAAARVEMEKARFLRALEVGVSVERADRPRRGDRNWLAETAQASAEAGQLSPPSLQPRERQTTDWVVGPTLGLEVPIFDQNQAQIARAEMEHAQAVAAVEGLEREVVQRAHVAVERARAARESARLYREELLPLRESGQRLAQEAYRVGGLTLFTVLEAQRALVTTRAAYVESLADAAAAMIEVERIAGRPRAALRVTGPSAALGVTTRPAVEGNR